jgi:hypothetical protein
MRHLLLSALMGGLVLLAPAHAPVPPDAGPELSTGPPIVYAVENPSQPSDAVPNSMVSGGTD